MKKLSIEKVNNGFIVRVIASGLNPLKEPYTKPVYVFDDLKALLSFLEMSFWEKDSSLD